MSTSESSSCATRFCLQWGEQVMNRRQFIARTGLGATAFLVAACQAPAAAPAPATAPPTTAPTNAPAAKPTAGGASATVAPTSAAAGAAPTATVAPASAAAPAPKRGGTLVMAQGADPNPVPTNIDGSAGTV